ncbi:MAG: class I SAM-dependent methyltransferase [Candidatus Omnitrophica bacterium]|nr:class I SAM-dependent methyltransferase [Candidatus Omnitrophota bacterium]
MHILSSIKVFNKETKKVNDKDIEEFFFNGKLPLSERIFFVQHLMPYVLFRHLCTGKRVLEIGIGKGFGSYYLSKVAKDVISLDFDYSCYYFLRQYLERYCIPNIRFINANAVYLPFIDRSFDCVITCQVIEHIELQKLNLFLQEIFRVLKNGGICLISTLNVEHSIKNTFTYEKFYQHEKEFNKNEFENLLRDIFPKIEIIGLDIGLKHRFYQRLKKWGFMKYNFCGFNPVLHFYNNILPKDFIFSENVTKRSRDLIALCLK